MASDAFTPSLFFRTTAQPTQLIPCLLLKIIVQLQRKPFALLIGNRCKADEVFQLNPCDLFRLGRLHRRHHVDVLHSTFTSLLLPTCVDLALRTAIASCVAASYNRMDSIVNYFYC